VATASIPLLALGSLAVPVVSAAHPGGLSGVAGSLPAAIVGPRSPHLDLTAAASPAPIVVPAVAGQVVGLGDAPPEGQPADVAGVTTAGLDVVGIARTPSGQGYWAVTATGGVYSFGDATFFGSLGGTPLNQPIVGIAATPDGRGYWLVAADGGVFSFGDAGFHGSLGSIHLNQPIVGIAATPTGGGYTMVAADGGVFSFGDAAFHGSLGSIHLNQPIVGIAATGTGEGYWLASADGGVFSFGDAAFHGSLGTIGTLATVSAIAASPSGDGYWLAGRDGGVFAFGDALYHGSVATSSADVTGLAPSADGAGYWEATGTPPAPAAPTVSAASVGAPAGMSSIGNFVITCYDLGGTTATGAPVGSNEIAVDPAVIPLGSTVYIAGVGTRVAEDTGGAIRGNRIDLWEPTASACADWGVETRTVYK
jgi:3D (Asp-Asp-Asp) domain-containing protein